MTEAGLLSAAAYLEVGYALDDRTQDNRTGREADA
jgi:hypothetical protein